MDARGRTDPFDPSFDVSGSRHSLNTVIHGRRGEHHQEQLVVQSPLVSRASSLSSPPAPAPAFFPNQPALWQLGRHSWYASGDDKSQRLSNAHEDRSPRSATTFFTRAADDKKDVEEAPYELGGTSEAQLRDVEEELHRGLKARQVRRTNKEKPG